MKKQFILIAAGAAMILAGCHKTAIEEPGVTVLSSEYNTSDAATTINVSVTANCDFEVAIPSGDSGWLTVESKTRNYIKLQLGRNEGARSRVSQVQLCVDGVTKASFLVGQAAPLLYPAPENKTFRRIAYFPSYRENDASSMPDDFLSTVDVACFAFATMNDKYTVDLQTGKGDLGTLVKRCHNLGIKVVLSFNGKWLDSRYTTMCKSATLRYKFIESVRAIVDEYELDGVDNDWEYPSSAGGSQQGNLLLMRELSNIYHAPGVGKFVTMAINPGVYTGKYTNGIDDGVFDCVDWFGSMIYDDYSTTTAGKNHASWQAMETSYNYWVGTRKLPASKFVGGIPAYGRPSGISQSGNTLSFSTIVNKGGDPDADEATVTTESHPEPFTIFYNGRVMVRNKVEFYQENQCGGYFFWEAGQDLTDDRSLLRTAAAAVK